MKKMFNSLLLAALLYGTAAADNSETILKLGDTFYRDSLHTMALTQYEKYVVSLPDPVKLPKVFFRIGMIYSDLGRDAEALDWFGRLKKRFPTDPQVKQALFESGLVYERRSQWFEAGEEFYQVWHIFSTSADAEEALFKAARSYGRGGDFQRSIELYRLYLTRFGASSRAGEAAANAVTLLLEKKEYNAAQELLGKARKQTMKDEWSDELTYLESVIIREVKDEESAEKRLGTLLSKKRDFRSRGEAISLYCELLANRKEYEKAWAVYPQFKEVKGESLTYDEKLFWAEVAFFSKEYASCTNIYKEALSDSAADSAQVNYLLARNYDAAGDFHRALMALRFVEKSGDAALSQSSKLKIAELYYKNGIYANSVQEYRGYLATSGDKSDMVLYRIGRIYQEKLSAPEMALREYDKLLKWYAGSPFMGRASLAMAEIYESRSEYANAFKTYRYLATLEGETALGKKALERSTYLEKFKIPHAVSAIADLTDLSLNDKLSPTERRIIGAGIYRDYLKDRFKAVELLKPLLDGELSEALKGQVLTALAINWKELSEQFVEEGKQSESDYAGKQAVGYYSTVLEDPQLNRWHDEARFELVALSGEGVKGYETFVETYPNSPSIGEAYMVIAGHYAGMKSKEELRTAAVAYKRAYESGAEELKEDALIGAIELYLNSGETDTAGVLLNTYKSEYSTKLKSEQYSWLQARHSHMSNDVAGARSLYLYVVDNFPQGKHTSMARLYLADAELALGKTGEAFNNYMLVSTLLPDGAQKGRAVLGQIEALILQGRADDALKTIDKYETVSWMNDEQRSMMRYQFGRVLAISGDSYGALKKYSAALKNDTFSGYRDVVRDAAELNYSLREYGAAADLYRKLRGTDSDRAVFYETRYLSSSILAGRGSVVADDYKAFKGGAGKSNPDKMLEIYYAEGLYFYREKEFGKAEKRFSYIIKKGGRFERVDDAAYYSALIYYDQKKKEDALKELQSFVTKYSESELVPSAMFTIALLYHQMEKFPEAGKQYEEVAKRAGDDAELRFRSLVNGTVIWQKLSAWEAAAQMSEAVLNEFGDRIDSSSYALKTGFAYLKANRVKRALTFFELAKVNPNPMDIPEISYWIAMSNLRLGKDEKALELFLKISYLYGNSGKWGVTADFEAARIYEQRGEFAKASSLYRKIVRIEGEGSPLGNDAKERITALNTLMEEY